MHQITIYGDIHANLPALEAVYADMRRRNLENRLCLGDLVGYGTFPDEVMELVRQSGDPVIMGNYDQGVGNSSDDCGCAYTTTEARLLGERSIAWTNLHTSEANKRYLRNLPFDFPLSLNGLNLHIVHGSPRRINEYLYEDRPERSLERLFEGTDYDAIVCGHTHKPYHRVLESSRKVINAGSVGKPKDGDPRACYLVLTADGGELNSEFIRVEYDVEKAAQAIEGSDMPNEFAEMLRSGSG